MFKIFKKILLGFCIIFVVAIVGVFVLVKTFNVNQFVAQNLPNINASIGRQISIKDVRLQFSLSKGVVLNVNGLTISDDQAFSKTPFLIVDNLKCGLDILSFLMKRQVIVSNVQVNSPRVVFIKDRAGKWNFQRLGKKETKKVPIEQPAVTQEENSEQQKVSENISDAQIAEVDVNKQVTEEMLSHLVIKALNLNNARLTLIDKTFDEQLQLIFEPVQFSVTDFSFIQPFEFSLDGALGGQEKSFALGGIVRIDPSSKQMRVDDVKINIDLEKIDFEKLKNIPMISSQHSLDYSGIGGEIDCLINQMVLGEEGLLLLTMEGSLLAAKASLNDLPFPLEGVNLRFNMSESLLKIEKLSLPIADGEIVVEASIDEYLTTKKFKGELKIKDVDLEEVSKLTEQPVVVQGKMSGLFEAKGKGFKLSDVRSNLNLEGGLSVKDGRIKGVNLLRLVFEKLEALGISSNRILESLPDEYKEKLKLNDTVFQKIEFKTKLENLSLNIVRAVIESTGFSVRGNGSLGLNKVLSLDTNFKIAKDLSMRLVNSIEDLRPLLDEESQVSIPLRIVGKIPEVRFIPDFEYLTKNVIVTKGKDLLKEVLDKNEGVRQILDAVFNIESKSQNSQGQGEGQETDGAEGKEDAVPVEERILDTIFEKIF